MSVQLSTVLSIARTYLNDDNATQFPDPVLIPKVQEAHRELQEELWVCGSPIVRNSALIAYVSGATTLTAPADLLCPTVLYENAQSSVVSAAGWIPMTEAFFIPLGIAQGSTLGFWCWQQEALTVVGANVNRAVYCQYRKLIALPAVSTDVIGILFGESYLASRTAAICAGTLGNAEVFTALTAVSKENLSKVISANRGQQKPSIKP